jgi:hypothetical protein
MRTAVDADTGEIFYAKKTKPKKKERWCRMFQIKLDEVAKDKDLRGMPLSVYLLMVSKVDYDNICRFPQILIADELGTTAQYVSKSIRLLREKNIISEVKERGTFVKAYSFSTDYVVKGKMPEEAIVDFDGEVVVEAEEKEIVKVTKPVFKGYDFDLFWIIYPKKVGKKECQKIWEKMKVSSEQFNAISYHLSLAYKDTEKKFMPNPATYLRGEKWDDEIIVESQKLGFDSEINSFDRPVDDGFNGNTYEGELN